MHSKIQEVIDELFLLDPALRKEEAKLRSIITAMLENRPDSILDQNFRSELRRRLDGEIRLMKKDVKPSRSMLQWIAPFLIGGVAFASLMVVSPLGQYLQDIIHPTKTVETPKNIALKQSGEPETTSIETSTPLSSDTAEMTGSIAEQTENIAPTPTPAPAPRKKNIPSSDRGGVIAFDLNIKKAGNQAFGAIKPTTSSVDASATESSRSSISA